MAATAMSVAKTVMEGVLQKLASTAADEVAKMLGVRQEVRYIRGELEMMQSFLMVAEDQQNNSVMRTWFRQVKDLAYRIEDCLEEFSFHLENRGLQYKLRTLCTRHRIASDIRNIKAEVQEVNQRYLRYNPIKPLDSSSDVTSRHVNITTRVAALVVEETELVGQSKPKKELIQKITTNNEHKKVVWVTGMGGLGKTTLTRNVFDNQEIKNHFKCRAWITVSQNFDFINILIDIGNQISGYKEATTKKGEELVNYVKYLLKESERYLVVLDDLWRTQDWNTIEHVFPDLKESCVVVTTRNNDVAEKCSWKSKEIHPLEPLSHQDSFDLILRKINEIKDFFHKKENKHLKDVIDEIIKKCRGLPLAVVTIGGLLASKSINEWEKVLNRLGSELETNPSTEAAKSILDLSYIDLPYHLKPCLLYLSIFPEDYEIERRTLVCRWMAEGYVRGRRGMTPEEVAEEYFYELINRSLIQPSKVGDDGMIRRCRVHDIMRELIVAKSIDENLICIADQGGQGNTNFRHLVVLPDSKEVEGANLKSIRSVTVFGGLVPDLLSSSRSKSKLLRTISMDYDVEDEDYPYKQFIKHVQQFVHLKYLSIPHAETTTLDDVKYDGSYKQYIKHVQQFVYLTCLSILDAKRLVLGNFQNLQTLELLGFPQRRINIAQLQQLRHVFIGKGYWVDGAKLDKGIRNLKELQSLDSVDIGRSHPRVVEELAELHQLKRLGVTYLKRKHFDKFSASISALSCLRSLRISIDLNEEAAVGCLDSVSSPPQHLRSFKLWGPIKKLPIWISLLHNLAKVTLWKTKLGDDAIVALQGLPSLVVLRLQWDSYVGAKLIFENNTFPKLRVLKLEWLKLEELVFKEHSLPQFEMLVIRFCPLEIGISGIEHLSKLKKLEVHGSGYVANLEMVQNQVAEHPNHPEFIHLDKDDVYIPPVVQESNDGNNSSSEASINGID